MQRVSFFEKISPASNAPPLPNPRRISLTEEEFSKFKSAVQFFSSEVNSFSEEKVKESSSSGNSVRGDQEDGISFMNGDLKSTFSTFLQLEKAVREVICRSKTELFQKEEELVGLSMKLSNLMNEKNQFQDKLNSTKKKEKDKEIQQRAHEQDQGQRGRSQPARSMVQTINKVKTALNLKLRK